jgi:hypothetical protein
MKKVSNSVFFGKANGHPNQVKDVKEHRYVLLRLFGKLVRHKLNKLKEQNFSRETILGILSSALNKRKNT